jgi:hypothetical protein
MTSRETFRTKSIATTWSRHVETIREEEKKRIQLFFAGVGVCFKLYTPFIFFLSVKVGPMSTFSTISPARILSD